MDTEAQTSWPFSVAFQVHEEGTGLEVAQPGLEPLPRWDACVAVGLTSVFAKLTPNVHAFDLQKNLCNYRFLIIYKKFRMRKHKGKASMWE